MKKRFSFWALMLAVALAFQYTPEQLESFYVTGNKEDWDEMYQEILLGLMKNGEGWSIFNLFNGVSGIYVDDLIIGQSLTATEAEHLYEDLASAATGTTVDVDTSITSTMEDPGKGEAEAEALKKAAQMHEDAEAAVFTALENLTQTGEFTGPALGDTENTVFSANVISVLRENYDKKNNWAWAKGTVVNPTETETGFTFSVTGYSIANSTNGSADEYYYLLSYGLIKNNANLACFKPDAQNWGTGIENPVYNYYENGSDTPTSNHYPTEWTVWSDTLSVCKVKLTVEYVRETKSVTVTWDLYEVDAGMTYTATQDYEGGTASASYTVPEQTYKVVQTATVAEDLMGGEIIMRLFNDHSAFFMTEVTGGTLS